MGITSSTRRVTAALLGAILVAPLLTGCVFVAEEWRALERSAEADGTPAPGVVKPAILAADPRVESVLSLQVELSGLARVMTVVVSVSGDEPVSTDTVHAVLVAAATNAQSKITYLDLMVVPASDTELVIDLEAAAEGLPPEVDWRWDDDTLTIIGPESLVAE